MYLPTLKILIKDLLVTQVAQMSVVLLFSLTLGIEPGPDLVKCQMPEL